MKLKGLLKYRPLKLLPLLKDSRRSLTKGVNKQRRLPPSAPLRNVQPLRGRQLKPLLRLKQPPKLRHKPLLRQRRRGWLPLKLRQLLRQKLNVRLKLRLKLRLKRRPKRRPLLRLKLSAWQTNRPLRRRKPAA